MARSGHILASAFGLREHGTEESYYMAIIPVLAEELQTIFDLQIPSR